MREDTDRRRGARLAAVQALFEMGINASDPEDVILRFTRQGNIARLNEDDVMVADPLLYQDIFRGTVRRQAELDALISPLLREDWRLERLPGLLRALLQAGAYELKMRLDIPPKVIISEYIALSSAFVDDAETAAVNAILDRLARRLRPEAMA